ncbi:DUF262 domain-containing protein [Lysobacter enzymogenes]|uniref:DUF262 domain-containing protein n=1 Tax=Lysobacter enzymogenes TaxID=69 RepID=UPI0019D1812B|nr:DUF262 domain-containing protein [Lysobacter enzymogenes]
MQALLNASATTAGSLFSNSTFEVPLYQREYAWQQDEVSEFWGDLKSSAGEDTYFLGLLILTEEGGRNHVVDGQQRLLTLTLLAAILNHEALKVGRKALAERIQSDFLYAIDYETDEVKPRVKLSDTIDDATLQSLIRNGKVQQLELLDEDSLSKRMYEAYSFLEKELQKDLKEDPFKKLGVWTEFITNKLYFAVFVHPDAASAYRVFEVINTRGRELTTADLLKNYVLSQTPVAERNKRYEQWQRIARNFTVAGSSSFVQYIRHVVTVRGGYILPKDLFDFIAQRQTFGSRQPPTIPELMNELEANLPIYLQMIDPTLDGPADNEALRIFSAFDSLGVISVRPLLLAIANVPSPIDGMRYVLRLVVRRIVAGNLGTGNVERLLSEAARNVAQANEWSAATSAMISLDPSDEAFLEQFETRSFNKAVLAFLRRSVVQKDMTPDHSGILHFIAPRQQIAWEGLTEEQMSYWGGTIANTYLATVDRRPKAASTWEGVKAVLLPSGVPKEITQNLQELEGWNEQSIQKIAEILTEAAKKVWCD